MGNFYVPLNSDGDLVSLFGAAWDQHPVAMKQGEDVLHPKRAINLGFAKFEGALKRAVDALQASDDYQPNDESHTSDALRAFEDLCYDAVELFDVYAQAIPKSIDLRPTPQHKKSEKRYFDTIKKCRDDWGFICNKIKHNHYVLAPVRQTSKRTGESVRGYVLLQPVGENQLNRSETFHHGETSRPFDATLQQMVHDLVECDLAASEVLRTLPMATGISPDNRPLVFRVGAQLRALANRRVYAGDLQKPSYEGFSLEENRVHFLRQNATRLPGQIEVSVVYRGDSYTTNFELV
ncbi:hypothetical protein [Ensifer adhaerens]